jgi:hypothetical protein
MSMLYDHVGSSISYCPRSCQSTCCMSMAMPHVHISMLHVMLHFHAGCPFCMFMHVLGAFPCYLSMSMLLVYDLAACPFTAAYPCPCCVYMPMLHAQVRAASPCLCSWCMSMSSCMFMSPYGVFMLHAMLHVMLHIQCSSCLSVLPVHGAFSRSMFIIHVRVACSCSMSMQHYIAACPCYMSMPHALAACSCCISMLLVHVACPSCISMLHVRTTCPCFINFFLSGSYLTVLLCLFRVVPLCFVFVSRRESTVSLRSENTPSVSL